MILRIDHVSIAVPDHGRAERFFQEVFGAIAGASDTDPDKQFLWRLYSLGDLSRLEIISPTGEGSFLDGFLRRRGGGVHHITLQTANIRQAMAHLDAHGIPYFGYHEYPGGVWKEIFIHPRDAFGVLIQISEFTADDWLAEAVKFPSGTRWQVERTPGGARLTFAHPGGGKVSLDLDPEEMARLASALASPGPG